MHSIRIILICTYALFQNQYVYMYVYNMHMYTNIPSETNHNNIIDLDSTGS